MLPLYIFGLPKKKKETRNKLVLIRILVYMTYSMISWTAFFDQNLNLETINGHEFVQKSTGRHESNPANGIIHLVTDYLF